MEELARITDTFLGIEDHGLLTFSLQLELASGGSIGAGLLSFDYLPSELHDKSMPWVGTARMIREILTVVGVAKWEALKGKEIYAIIEDGTGRLGPVIGIKTGPFRQHSRSLIFREVFEEFREATKAFESAVYAS